MTKTELSKYKNILVAKQAELEQLVRNREGIAIEKSPDALDEVQHAAERELAIRNLDRESNLLRNVRAALRRIEGVRDVRTENGAVLLQVTELHTSVPALLAELTRQNVSLTELRTHSATLEDVFVTLTGRHLRDE